MSTSKSSRNSLQHRSGARLAAVQCLYNLSMREGKVSAERVITEYRTRDGEGREQEWSAAATPDWKYVEKLVYGVQGSREELAGRIDPYLRGDWKKERMGPLMMALIETAFYELLYLEMKPAIITDEYVTLAGEFLGEAEQGFINALLDKFAQSLRDA